MKKISLLSFTLFMVLAMVGCSEFDSAEYRVKHASAKALFVHGDFALRQKSYPEAIQYFEALDDRFPFSDYMEQSQSSLVYAYYALKQYDNAMAVADSYINAFADGKHADYVYFMRGLIFFERDQTWLKQQFRREPGLGDMTNMRAAFDSFIEIVSHYPKSPYAPDAHRRMVYIRNQLADSELLAAKYYYHKHAFMAAIARLDYLLSHYPEAPQQSQAMKMRQSAYGLLGLKPPLLPH